MSLRSNIRFHALLLAPVLIVLLLVIYFSTTKISTVFTLFSFAAVGGVTSNYLRLRDLPIADSTPTDEDSRRLAILQLYLSPIVAGLFGLILFMAMVGKLVSGALFPAFVEPASNPDDILAPFTAAKVASAADAAKLCIWAFIAGFAEKLVPNVIDRLVAESNKKKG